MKYAGGGLSATSDEIHWWETFRPEISRFVSAGKIWTDPVTGKPLAATAGAMTFTRGGNAVDAACAMLAATSTMWDTLGWGGETQALIYNPHTGEVKGINALGVAPSGATAEFFQEQGMVYPPEYGPLAAVTPGTPGGVSLAPSVVPLPAAAWLFITGVLAIFKIIPRRSRITDANSRVVPRRRNVSKVGHSQAPDITGPGLILQPETSGVRSR